MDSAGHIKVKMLGAVGAQAVDALRKAEDLRRMVQRRHQATDTARSIGSSGAGTSASSSGSARTSSTVRVRDLTP